MVRKLETFVRRTPQVIVRRNPCLRAKFALLRGGRYQWAILLMQVRNARCADTTRPRGATDTACLRDELWVVAHAVGARATVQPLRRRVGVAI